MRSRISASVTCVGAVRSAVTWLGDAGLDLGEHRDAGADLARRAVAALVAVVLDERRLHRMQGLGLAQTLDGGDFAALVHDRERQA